MKALIDFGRWLIKTLFPSTESPRFRSALVEDLPDKMEPRVVYGIGTGTPWSAALHCPCNCGTVIHLSLLKNERPHWDLTQTPDGAPTLYPSVWRTEGCKAHFVLREGKVLWCKFGRPMQQR
jgi:hypothetical protein